MIKRLSAFGAPLAIVLGGFIALAPAQAQERAQETQGECESFVHTDLSDINIIADDVDGDPDVSLQDDGVRTHTTAFSGQGAKWWHSVDPTPLAEVTGLSYDVTTHTAAFAGGSGEGVGPNLPAFLLEVMLPDESTATLVYEPYYSDEWGTGNEYVLDLVGTTYTWDVSGSGQWWSNADGLAGIGGGGSYASNQTLAEILGEHPETVVTAFGFQQTWADNLDATVNNISFATESNCERHSWTKPEPCEWDPELLADDEKCVKPDDTDSDQDADTESETDSTPAPVPTAVPAGSEPANTGVNPGLVGLAVVGIAGLGVGGLWLRRRFDH